MAGFWWGVVAGVLGTYSLSLLVGMAVGARLARGNHDRG